MNQNIINLYDEYTHKPLSRREFLGRLATLTGSMAAATALVPLLAANQAKAGIVPVDDARLEAGRISFPGAQGDVSAYLARPTNSEKLPAVIVIHENRGLNAHTEDVTRRLALEGFLVLAPDCLSSVGGTPTNEDAARELIGKLDKAAVLNDLKAAISFLAGHEHGNGKVGAVGFCWGGGMVGQLAVTEPELGAGVVYYGMQPDVADVPKIQSPLLLHYAGLDERINAGVAGFEATLKEHGKAYTLHIYEGVNHAFNNDTSEARYNKQAADLAWARTVEFLKAQLGA